MPTEPRDAMQFVNEQDAATIERFIERLEFRARDPTFAAYLEAYLSLLDLPREAVVLELGCGTGVVARAIAARDGFAGTVTGVDQSPAFIAAAGRLAAGDGVADRVEFAVGDAHALEFPPGSFDTVVAHTLVSHVRDPLAVLTEARRMLRPGGAVVVFDGDYASLTFGTSDPRLGRGDGGGAPIRDHEHPEGDARAPPHAPRGPARADRHAGTRVRGGGNRGGFFLGLAETYGPLAASTGLVPATDVEAWLDDQRRSAEDGTFFAACNYYAYVAHALESSSGRRD